MRFRTRRLVSGRRSCPSGPSRRGGRGLLGAIAVALAAIVGGAAPCSAAGLMIEAPNLTVTAGSSGSFDLLLKNTNPIGGDSYNINADQFLVSLTGPLGISFTNVTIATDPVAAPYIFLSSGTTQPGGGNAALHEPHSDFVHGARLRIREPVLPDGEPARHLRPGSRFLLGGLDHPRRDHRRAHDFPIGQLALWP